MEWSLHFLSRYTKDNERAKTGVTLYHGQFKKSNVSSPKEPNKNKPGKPKRTKKGVSVNVQRKRAADDHRGPSLGVFPSTIVRLTSILQDPLPETSNPLTLGVFFMLPETEDEQAHLNEKNHFLRFIDFPPTITVNSTCQLYLRSVYFGTGMLYFQVGQWLFYDNLLGFNDTANMYEVSPKLVDPGWTQWEEKHIAKRPFTVLYEIETATFPVNQLKAGNLPHHHMIVWLKEDDGTAESRMKIVANIRASIMTMIDKTELEELRNDGVIRSHSHMIELLEKTTESEDWHTT